MSFYKMPKENVKLHKSKMVVVYGGDRVLANNIGNIRSVFTISYICNEEKDFGNPAPEIPYINIKKLRGLKSKHKDIFIILAEDNMRCAKAREALAKYKIPMMHYYDALCAKYDVYSSDLAKSKIFDYKDENNNTIRIKGDRIPDKLRVHFEGCDNHLFIGEDVYFGDLDTKDVFVRMHGVNNVLKIGSGTTVGQADFVLLGNAKVKIGKDCLMSRNIVFHPVDGHHIFRLDTLKRSNYPREIVVGNHVWVGQDVTLLGGANVGDGCIIAYGALVTGKKFDENKLLKGTPAEIMCSKKDGADAPVDICWSRDSTNWYSYDDVEDCGDQYGLKLKRTETAEEKE